jgi:MFS family permease
MSASNSFPTPNLVDRRSFAFIVGLFAAFGLTYGLWVVVLADLKHALDLSPGALGAALTLGTFASLPAMFLGGPLIDRLGTRYVIMTAALMMAAAMMGFFWVNHYAILILVLLILFGASGVYDVGINAAAVNYEQIRQRRVLTYFHAAFSGAGALGALMAGTLLYAQVPFRAIYLFIAGLLTGMGILVWRSRRLPTQSTATQGVKTTHLYKAPVIVLLGVITALGMLSEGTLEAWSAIYLRSYLELPTLLGASGVAVFHGAMLLGRLGAAPMVARLSRKTLLQGAGFMAAAGMTLALSSETPAVILAGFLVVGLGLALVVPVGFSLAGDLASGRTGEATAAIAVMSYIGFLVGPAFIGTLAEWLGLRLALATVVVAGLLIAMLGSRVRIATG